MNEDAYCNNPCGAEPMGCRTCDLVTGTAYAEQYVEYEPFLLVCLECGYEWEDINSTYTCPKCKATDIEVLT